MLARLFVGAALVGLVVVVFVATPEPPWRLAAVAVALAGAVGLGLLGGQTQRATPEAGSQREGGGWAQASEATRAPASAEPAASGVAEILERLPVGVMVIGDDGRIRSFNAAAGELFGVDPARARGRTLIEIVRNFELDRRVAATLREGAEETWELAYAAAQSRQLQVTTRAIAGPDGGREALVIASDQTRVRELEKLRREFVSNVSHELRTPLTAVKLMVETLQQGVERPARDEFLSQVARETERMIVLVEELLDLARLESGKLELRVGAVDVAELCRQAVALNVPRAAALGVTLECSVPEAPITIAADRDKLFQVVVNLLDNALRHTPAGGRVSLTASVKDGEVEIVVADTGSGIPSTALPHIFERFYVVDPARARSGSGTGLGLAIVKHIVEAHGGTIRAESELGAGTRFRCTFTIA